MFPKNCIHCAVHILILAGSTQVLLFRCRTFRLTGGTFATEFIFETICERELRLFDAGKGVDGEVWRSGMTGIDGELNL